jgi:RNA polymerase sigma-70 factor (ECF subfamily)
VRPDPAAVSPAGEDPDADCLAPAAAGDEAAFATLVDRHLVRLHGLAARILGVQAEAEDVVQETLLRAWRELPRWRPGAARFSTWLQRVALNLVNDRLRRRREQIGLEAIDLVDGVPGPEPGLVRAELAQQVRAALQQLPPRQRDALLLCHYQGLGNIEAAAILEVSVDALESLLARGRRALRDRLTDAA